MKKRTRIFLLGVYSLLLFWLVIGQRMGQPGEGLLQLQPLKTLRHFFWVMAESNSPGLRRHAFVNLVGNVAMFVPLGFLLPWIWQKWQVFWRHFLLMAALILAVEVSQYMLRLGTCDVDDLLLNLLGAVFGYVLFRLLPRKCQ